MGMSKLTGAPERADHLGNVTALFDGDNASPAARASIRVSALMRADEVERAYEEAAYRLDVHTRYELVLDSGDESAERAVLAEAAAFDKAHPASPSLAGELRSKTLGLAA